MDNACAAKIEAMRALLIRDQTEDTRATVECRVEDVAYAFRWVYAITDHGRLACSPEHMMEMGERLMRAHEHITRNAMARNGHRDHLRYVCLLYCIVVYCISVCCIVYCVLCETKRLMGCVSLCVQG